MVEGDADLVGESLPAPLGSFRRGRWPMGMEPGGRGIGIDRRGNHSAGPSGRVGEAPQRLPQRGSHGPGLQGRGGPTTIVWRLVSRWNQRIDRPPFDVVRWVPHEAVRRQNATRSRVTGTASDARRSERNREGEAAASSAKVGVVLLTDHDHIDRPRESRLVGVRWVAAADKHPPRGIGPALKVVVHVLAAHDSSPPKKSGNQEAGRT